MAAEVKVDPELLRKAQRVCSDLHADVAGDEPEIDAATVDAARGVAGWGMQRALEDLLWWWRDDLARLGGYLDTYGAALTRAAAAYELSDHASVDLFDIRGR